MNISNFLAELWGITMAVVSLAFLLKPKLLENIFKETQNDATMFFWGTVSLVVGIAMVLVHNVWVADWRIIITLMGWLTLIKGLDSLFFPERMRKRWPNIARTTWIFIFLFMLMVGLLLTFLGFTR